MSNHQSDIALENISQSLPTPVPHQAGRGDRGHGIFAFLGWNSEWNDDEEDLDDFERSLWAKRKKDPSLLPLIQDYAQLKEMTNPALFGALIRCNVLDLSASNYTNSEWRSGKQSFSNELGSLRTFLGSGNSDCVRFCLLASKLYSKADPKLPLRTRMFASRSQMKRKLEAPKTAMVYLLSQEWALSDEVTQVCLGTPAASRPSYKLILPSREPTEALFTIRSNDPLSFRLTWFARVPKYESDIYTYVWRPHINFPVPQAAEVFINRVDCGPRNVLVFVNSGLDEVQGLVDYYETMDKHSLAADDGSLSASGSIVALLCELCSLMINDVSSFLCDASEYLNELTLNGRAHPSAGKIQYLLHLDDCRHMSLSGLSHALQLLQGLQDIVEDAFPAPETSCTRVDDEDSSTQSSPVKLREPSAACRRVECIRNDLEYLSKKLVDMEAHILAVRAMIKDQLDLSQMRRTYIFTFLIAIYVPFSFISSLFGMNLSNPLWPSAKIGDNKTVIHDVTSVGSANASLQAHTEAVVNAINDSGPHLWNFKSYWYITVPLTIATIVLPIIAGAIFRIVLIAFRRYNSYLRWTLPLLCLLAVTALNITISKLIYTIIFGCPLGGLALGMLIKVSYTGKQQLLWCAYATLFTYSICIDLVIFLPMGLTGYLPLIFLSLFWLRKDIRIFFKIRFRYPRVLWSYISRLALRLQRIAEYLDSHRILQFFTFAGVYGGADVLILLFTPRRVHLTLFAVPLGILAINRLIRSYDKQEKFIWLIYTGLYICTITLDLLDHPSRDDDVFGLRPRYVLHRPYGFVTWVPVTWLAVVHVSPALVRLAKQADQTLWKMTGRATTRTIH